MIATATTFLILLSTGITADPPPAPLGPSDTEKVEIARLIRDLAHSDFDIREAASESLAKFEGKAYRFLQTAQATNLDAETRHRCGLLLPAARMANLNTRLAAYLADTNGQYTHDLPGLARFMEITQGTSTAREMFSEMVRDPSTQKLLLIVEADPSAIPSAIVNRSMEMQNRLNRSPALPPPGLVVRPPVVNPASGNQPNVTELLGLFFVDSLSPKAAQVRRIGIGPSTYLYQPALRNVLISNEPNGKPIPLTDERAKVARAILQGWFDTREEAYEINIAVSYAIQYEMPDVVIRSATKQLANKQAIYAIRGQAIGALGRYAKDKSITQLEQLMKDETNAGSRFEQVADENGKFINKSYPIQSRDVALAMLLNAKGLKHADYGMKVFSTSEAMKYQATNQWFKTDEDRDAGFKKYEDERKKEATKVKK